MSDDTHMRVRRLASGDVTDWLQTTDGQVFIRDLVTQDTDPDAKMTVGFGRLAKGETFEMSFVYDEVLVVTKGTLATRTEHGETLTAHAGDVVYLPAGSRNAYAAEGDTELAYVAAPPEVYAGAAADAAAAPDA